MEGSKTTVGVFGEVANPAGNDPTRVRLGVEADRQLFGPFSAWTASWVEKNLDGDNPWGWGAGGGLRMRF